MSCVPNLVLDAMGDGRGRAGGGGGGSGGGRSKRRRRRRKKRRRRRRRRTRQHVILTGEDRALLALLFSICETLDK